MARFPRTRTAVAGVVLAAVALGACSDDDDEPTDDTSAESTTTSGVDDTTSTTAGDGDTSTTDGGEATGETVEVAATDYAFGGVPDTIAAGTELRIVNQSDAELHEIVAVLLPEDEARPVDELIEGDLSTLFSGEPALVALAMPGSDEQIVPIGDGTLTEPGRYLLLCTIPQGVDPDEYMAAAEEAGGERPDVEGGPPHFTLGMFGEVTVE